MREKLIWHLERLVEFYDMKLNCSNCKYSASLGYWKSDKEDIQVLIARMKKGAVFLARREEN